ncbi:MAG: FAD-dependent oxidoreductase, partial [Chloroflexota bacterium]
MSAAQELAERKAYDNLEISVYEANPTIPGGKARSLPVPNSGVDGREDLPAEHGFRAFLDSYRHMPDTMKRIPYDRKTVFDNLVDTSKLLFGRFNKAPFVVNTRLPRGFGDFTPTLSALFDFQQTGLTPDDLVFFNRKLWQIATSCYERRIAEYEKMSWWHFIGAEERSQAYQNFLADGLSRCITANDPHQGNVKTLGDVALQVIMSATDLGTTVMKVLNGPTNEAWIDPWHHYLEKLGVHYRFGAEVEAIHYENGCIQRVKVKFADGYTEYIEGDYFIFAVPVEVMAALLEKNQQDDPSKSLIKADPNLAGILKLKDQVGWMCGLMFYLTEDIPIVYGHQIYIESPWALSSVSHLQFWRGTGYKIGDHGDGQAKGILSTIISDWDVPGLVYGKPAKACTP